MNSSQQPIAITGLGAISPLGESAKSTVAAYLRGDQAIQVLKGQDVDDFAVRIGAPVSSPIEEFFPAHRSRRLDRATQFALHATSEAWSDNHANSYQSERIGVVFSSGIGGVNSLIKQLRVLEKRGPSKVSPHTVGMIMPNAAAAQVSIQVGASGWLEAPVSACAGGAEAILRAVMLLRSGLIDVVIAGGTEAILNRFGIASFAAMQALSTTNEEPSRACRPFDRDRNGFVMGEGAAVLVLERLDNALARGAHLHGFVRGIGTTADGFDIVSPRPHGRQAHKAMKLALADAAVDVDQLQLVKAHATGTPVGDLAEARALAQLWSTSAQNAATNLNRRPWLIAPKAGLGHLISASGPLECILTLAALNAERIPHQLNCEHPEPILPFALPSKSQTLMPIPGVAPLALVNSFGFGGKNVSLVIEGVGAQAPSS